MSSLFPSKCGVFSTKQHEKTLDCWHLFDTMSRLNNPFPPFNSLPVANVRVALRFRVACLSCPSHRLELH
jgi:hypothetical protein